MNIEENETDIRKDATYNISLLFTTVFLLHLFVQSVHFKDYKYIFWDT
jgi:hypothetical protein